MNKFLTKIAKEVPVRDELDDPDFGRATLKATAYGAGLGAVGAAVSRGMSGRGRVLTPAGIGMGVASGLSSSFKNQLREQQVHDIKLQGAHQRQESHDARMAKHAFSIPDMFPDSIGSAIERFAEGPLNSAAKHLKNNKKLYAVGVGSGLAGVALGRLSKPDKLVEKHAHLLSDQTKKDLVGTGTIAALGGVGSVATNNILHGGSIAGKGSGKAFAVGTGVGLIADYAGLKLSHAFNKHVDRNALVKHAAEKYKNTKQENVATAAGTVVGAHEGFKAGVKTNPVQTTKGIHPGGWTEIHTGRPAGWKPRVAGKAAVGAAIGGLAAGALAGKIRSLMTKKEEK